jgi:hypothetical protein
MNASLTIDVYQDDHFCNVCIVVIGLTEIEWVSSRNLPTGSVIVPVWWLPMRMNTSAILALRIIKARRQIARKIKALRFSGAPLFIGASAEAGVGASWSGRKFCGPLAPGFHD